MTSFFAHVNDCVARYLITIPRLLFTLNHLISEQHIHIYTERSNSSTCVDRNPHPITLEYQTFVHLRRSKAYITLIATGMPRFTLPRVSGPLFFLPGISLLPTPIEGFTTSDSGRTALRCGNHRSRLGHPGPHTPPRFLIVPCSLRLSASWRCPTLLPS